MGRNHSPLRNTGSSLLLHQLYAEEPCGQFLHQHGVVQGYGDFPIHHPVLPVLRVAVPDADVQPSAHSIADENEKEKKPSVHTQHLAVHHTDFPLHSADRYIAEFQERKRVEPAYGQPHLSGKGSGSRAILYPPLCFPPLRRISLCWR